MEGEAVAKQDFVQTKKITMTEKEKNASDKAQKLISRFISECEVDEDSAK